ncbi:MAG: transporter substrate-binding domain-containing protein, partial [Treponema sp.]|nr:transporter substrate-binding domain-containing protein [Treponema sp.]
MKKRGILLLLVCALLIAAGTDVFAGGKQEPGGAKAFIIATDTTFAPFEFQDAGGSYVGVDIDLLAAIAADQGFAYELKPLGFSAAVAALESNQA